MVVRKGFKAFLVPVSLYAMAFAAAGFFVTQARQGDRGLEAKHELRKEEQKIVAELEKLQAERDEWESKVALFRAEALDKDLLDERVRRVLNRAHRHEVTIFTR